MPRWTTRECSTRWHRGVTPVVHVVHTPYGDNEIFNGDERRSPRSRLDNRDNPLQARKVMEVSVKREDLVKGLYLVQGVVERRNTLPILANVLIEPAAEGIAIT